MGWAVLVQEPCLLWKLSTLLRLKRKREKKRKGKRVENYFYFGFFNIIWCLFLIASRACKNIYLSFYLKEVFFFLKFTWFYFFSYFCFCLGNGLRCFFLFPPPLFFVCLFVLISYQKIGKPNVLISLLPTNHGVGQCCFSAHSMPEVHNFS